MFTMMSGFEPSVVTLLLSAHSITAAHRVLLLLHLGISVVGSNLGDQVAWLPALALTLNSLD